MYIHNAPASAHALTQNSTVINEQENSAYGWHQSGMSMRQFCIHGAGLVRQALLGGWCMYATMGCINMIILDYMTVVSLVGK